MLGEAVRQYRLDAGLSTRKFAAMAGTSINYLWEIETGKTNPGLSMICDIADALDVPVRDLVDF